MKLGLISLGCDKNTVDSERMLAILVGHGAERVADPAEAEVILVNTCGFIDAAKEESIETLLRAAEHKRDSDCQALVAVGCMVERYREEMSESLPEVDLFLGLRDLDRLVPELRGMGLLNGEPSGHPGDRLPIGSRHVSYLKVSEGCNHGCAFCAIPIWRGRHRSFELDRLVAEAQRLEMQGAVELNLVAQDLAHYGMDLRDGTDASTLLRNLLEHTSIPWFRLLYIYSAGIREPLVDLMAAESRILPYIDMPIQHAADPVLARMRRPERRATLLEKIAWMRDQIPGLTLRTTVMVGFPGETDEDYRDLLDFMEEVRFDRLGAFAFSPQDGTRAAGLEELFVPRDLASERLEELLEVQRAISADSMALERGRSRLALVDGPADRDEPLLERFEVDWNPGLAVGRISTQADDVDGLTLIAAESPLGIGQLVRVEVRQSHDYDLLATAEKGEAASAAASVSRPGRAAGRGHERPRSLPVAPLGLDTAWGK